MAIPALAKLDSVLSHIVFLYTFFWFKESIISQNRANAKTYRENENDQTMSRVNRIAIYFI